MAGGIFRSSGGGVESGQPYRLPRGLAVKPRRPGGPVISDSRKRQLDWLDLVEVPDGVVAAVAAWHEAKTDPYPGPPDALVALGVGSLVREHRREWGRGRTARANTARIAVGRALADAGDELFDQCRRRFTEALAADADGPFYVVLHRVMPALRLNGLVDGLTHKDQPRGVLDAHDPLWMMRRPDLWFAAGQPSIGVALAKAHPEWGVGVYSAQQVLEHAPVIRDAVADAWAAQHGRTVII
jgi:hypothetical protein